MWEVLTRNCTQKNRQELHDSILNKRILSLLCNEIYVFYIWIFVNVLGEEHLDSASKMPKNIRCLSERRRNQIIQSRHAATLQSIKSTTKEPSTNGRLNMEVTLLENVSSSPQTAILVPNAYDEGNVPMEAPDNLFNEANSYFQVRHDTPTSTSARSEDNCQPNVSNFEKDFVQWVKSEGVTLQSVNKLLKLFRKHGLASNLPTDSRTLLKTPKNTSKLIEIKNGSSYTHFDTETCIIRSLAQHFDHCPDKIELLVNCIGMSLSKCSSSQFWPI